MSANVKPLLYDRLRESELLDAAQLEELAGLPEALDPEPAPRGPDPRETGDGAAWRA
jgi:hypothetical protein